MTLRGGAIYLRMWRWGFRGVVMELWAGLRHCYPIKRWGWSYARGGASGCGAGLAPRTEQQVAGVRHGTAGSGVEMTLRGDPTYPQGTS